MKTQIILIKIIVFTEKHILCKTVKTVKLTQHSTSATQGGRFKK